MKKNYDHIHKYERRRLGSWKKTGHEIYKCAVPGCTHYMIDMEAVIGRYSQCWGDLGMDGNGRAIPCKNVVEMTRYIVTNERRKRPLCGACKLRRKEEKEEKFDQSQDHEKVRQEAIERITEGLKNANTIND